MPQYSLLLCVCVCVCGTHNNRCTQWRKHLDHCNCYCPLYFFYYLSIHLLIMSWHEKKRCSIDQWKYHSRFDSFNKLSATGTLSILNWILIWFGICQGHHYHTNIYGNERTTTTKDLMPMARPFFLHCIQQSIAEYVSLCIMAHSWTQLDMHTLRHSECESMCDKKWTHSIRIYIYSHRYDIVVTLFRFQKGFTLQWIDTRTRSIWPQIVCTCVCMSLGSPWILSPAAAVICYFTCCVLCSCFLPMRHN